jgi:hypothetical protein
MNDITAPKLAPPFHRTAASGTLPIEQTKEMIATKGPMRGPTSFAKNRVIAQKEDLPELVWNPGGERASDQQSADDIGPQGDPIHHEEVANRRHALRRGEPMPERALLFNRHVHRRVSLHPAGDTFVGLSFGVIAQAAREEESEQHNQDDDHQRPADELSERELPAHQHP